jgi:hypothetical protein
VRRSAVVHKRVRFMRLMRFKGLPTCPGTRYNLPSGRLFLKVRKERNQSPS